MGELGNGNFEDTLTGWTASAGASHDTSVFRSGAGSAKLTVTAGGYQQIAKNGLLTLGETYQIELWAKVSDITKRPGGVDIGSGNVNNLPFATDTNWNRYVVEGVCSGDTNLRFPRATASGDYTINYDDIQIRLIESP
jgi:hypothetical protein